MRQVALTGSDCWDGAVILLPLVESFKRAPPHACVGVNMMGAVQQRHQHHSHCYTSWADYGGALAIPP